MKYHGNYEQTRKRRAWRGEKEGRERVKKELEKEEIREGLRKSIGIP